ncbi:SRPBCC family protein [Actinomadura chibensis]|uniref:SRPBCC family protein n=1 Tax=Actinomadura chibensis TaxID=392828 RepID=UPI000B07674B|nr:SRPBCC domain-containing protein [Actinomadura chibensis]
MTERFGEDLVVDESIVIRAPARQVWRTIVDADARAGWWEYLDLDATPGGRFEERWTGDDGTEQITSGEVVELADARLLVLSWADDGWPAATRVEVTLDPGDGGPDDGGPGDGGATTVRLRHTGWEALPDGAALAAAHRGGWLHHLDNLRRCAERADA